MHIFCFWLGAWRLDWARSGRWASSRIAWGCCLVESWRKVKLRRTFAPSRDDLKTSNGVVGRGTVSGVRTIGLR